MVCSTCGTENRAGRKFCSNCGTALAVGCPSCGAANEPGDRFCGECGTSISATTAPAGNGAATSVAPPPTSGAPQAAPVAERRLVSVLFADLVGFTALSEHRDAEDVRELLSRYFDVGRQVIGRYGGTVEKFIGDAVMAVWGAPVAQEDDAERAVRAALDLVEAVAALGEELHASGLALRAGVATGEAAVTLGATGEGLVAGDLVNTASRVQSVAAPGGVLVTDATRRPTEAAILYEDGGTHELKGKAEPVRLSRAIRVIALRGGELRSIGLEAPFVGREREFRLLKDLLHSSIEDRKAHLLSVTGIGGIGKSRLSWEFFKYIDGLADDLWWHRGRCIAYGDGVTYWAFAEMVRMRARIVEDDEPDVAARNLHDALLEIVADEGERAFIEPRLAHLLGLGDMTSPAREELFAAWRLFVEAMSERWPVLMVFEDLQWADEALLDFIEHLLEWSRTRPILVVTLARPELLERRPTWGANRHGSTSLSLEPLAEDAMDALLRGMVPGLGEDLLRRISERAEGIPLYAVETVRMLLDRGLLRREGERYEPVGAIDELAVPETLQALIAARIDGLPPEERAIVQDASVLGKTFTVAAIAAVSGRSADDVEPLLSSLVRKEVLGVQLDPRSPERGQYGFLQALMQKVAYETLSKRDRRAKHLAAAEHLEGAFIDEDEIVEVVAAHLLEAHRLGPEDEDGDALRDRARTMLTRAGERARALAAMNLAAGYFSRAAELTSEPVERAGLLERAGAATSTSSPQDAVAELENAYALFEGAGQRHAAARVLARMGEMLWVSDRPLEGIDRMLEALEMLKDDEPDHSIAMLNASAGKILVFLGRLDEAARRIDRAIEIGEALWLPDVLSDAIDSKGILAGTRGLHEEELALVRRALDLALENDLVGEAARAYNNLAFAFGTRDRFDEVLDYVERGIELAERYGLGPPLGFFVGARADAWFITGNWNEIDAYVEELAATEQLTHFFYGGHEILAGDVLQVAAARADADLADRVVGFIGDPETEDQQTAAFRRAALAAYAAAHGDHAAALDHVRRALPSVPTVGLRHDVVKHLIPRGVTSALALGDPAAADEVLATLADAPPASLSPLQRAQFAHLGALRTIADGGSEHVESRLKQAAGLFRELGTPFPLAETLLELGEWLCAQGGRGNAEPLVREAAEVFERLRVPRHLERAERLLGERASA